MTDNRNAYLRVGATAAAVFVALLLAGVARGEAPSERGVPTNATPDSYDPGSRESPSRRERFGGPGRDDGAPGGSTVPDFGEGAPGGGSVPDLGAAEPDPGGGVAPDPGDAAPAPGSTDGATT